MARKSLKNKKIAPIESPELNDSNNDNVMLYPNENVITSIPSAEEARQQAIRAQRIKNLKPIAKGTVLNPEGKSGWTTGKSRMLMMALSAQEKAMKVLIKQLNSKDERIAQQASRELLDRAFGKAVSPVANVDSKGDDVPPPPPMVVIGVKSS